MSANPQENKAIEDVSDLTGEKSSNRFPVSLDLNEVRMNGKDGIFSLYILVGREKKQEVKSEILGNSITIVPLLIRRRIQGFKKGNKTMGEFDQFFTSTEHNDKRDVIFLKGAKEKGISEDLYNKYLVTHRMKAQRVVYCYLIREGHERELVRLIVKGATLSSKRESKITAPTDLVPHVPTDFFDFINEKKPEGQHMYMFVTKLTSIPEDGPQGLIYSIDFKRGAKLPEDKLRIVVDEVKKLHAHKVEQDAYYKKTDAATIAPKVEIDTVEYPSAEEEGVDADAIPF